MKSYPYPAQLGDVALRPPSGTADRRFCFDVRDRARRVLERRALFPFPRDAQWRDFLGARYRPRDARVLWRDGARVGYFQIQFLRWREVYVDMLYLDPAARGQGLAGRMLDHVRVTARAQGFAASISVMLWNRAYDLYRRHGFAVAHDRAHPHSRVSRWMRLRPHYPPILRGRAHYGAAGRAKT